MGFDLNTAKSFGGGGFDLGSAKALDSPGMVQQPPSQQIPPPPQSEAAIAGAAPMMGVVEPVLQMGTGLAASAAGGLRGLGTLATGGGLEQAGRDIQETQEKYTYQPKHPAGQAVAEGLAWPIEKATEGWGMIGEQIAGDEGKLVGETAFPAAAILLGRPWRMGKKPPVSEANLLGQLNKTVKKGLDKSKAIAPVKKGTGKSIDKAYSDATDAIQSIIKRKDELTYFDEIGPIGSGRVPQNLGEFSQSIGQLKKVIYDKYNAMQKQASGSGAKVNLDNIISELEAVVKNEGLIDNSPGVVRFAQKRLDALKKRGEYTPEVAQSVIAELNKKLDAYSKQPNATLTSNMGVEAVIVNRLRKSLDDSIAGAVGEGYAPLKAEYGSLSSIEKAVNVRMLRDNQSSGATALNFYDVFSAHDILGGTLTGNPIQAAKGVGLGAVSGAIRLAKDPNRTIRKMFKDAEKTVGKLERLFPEKEAAAVVASIEQQLQLPPGQNQLALPAPQKAMQMGDTPTGTIPMGGPKGMFREPNSWEKLFEIAQSTEGKRLLVERLGKEAKHAELVAELMKVPELPALPPGQGFQLQGPRGSNPYSPQLAGELNQMNQLALPPGPNMGNPNFQLKGNPGTPNALAIQKGVSRRANLNLLGR